VKKEVSAYWGLDLLWEVETKRLGKRSWGVGRVRTYIRIPKRKKMLGKKGGGRETWKGKRKKKKSG